MRSKKPIMKTKENLQENIKINQIKYGNIKGRNFERKR